MADYHDILEALMIERSPDVIARLEDLLGKDHSIPWQLELPEPLPQPTYSLSHTPANLHTQRALFVRWGLITAQWQRLPACYFCRVVRVCSPPSVSRMSYYGLPFLPLVPRNIVEILLAAGHPSTHPDIPVHVQNTDKCVLLARNEDGNLGWVLAGFLRPVEQDLPRPAVDGSQVPIAFASQASAPTLASQDFCPTGFVFDFLKQDTSSTDGPDVDNKRWSETSIISRSTYKSTQSRSSYKSRINQTLIPPGSAFLR